MAAVQDDGTQQSMLQRAREVLAQQRKDLRPAAEFLARPSNPKTAAEVTRRVRHNVPKFWANYVLVTLALAAYALYARKEGIFAVEERRGKREREERGYEREEQREDGGDRRGRATREEIVRGREEEESKGNSKESKRRSEKGEGRRRGKEGEQAVYGCLVSAMEEKGARRERSEQREQEKGKQGRKIS